MSAPGRRAKFYRPPRACDVGSFRIATSFLRRLPDFLIIGTQRGGTTSLHEYLSRHPGIAPATEKEIHYFDFQRSRGPRWYRAHFPLLGKRITGEATPFYMFHPRAPQAVHALLPRVKLIVMLRNPVDRAHSHYRLQRRAKIEPLETFEEALAAERERLADEAPRVAREEDYYSYAFQHYSYVARGDYQLQLAAWRKLFPAEQMLIFPSETFYAQPRVTFGRVCDFLGLGCPSETLANPPNLNHAEGAEMSAETRRSLERHFAPLNEELSRTLGEPLPWS